MKLEIIMKKRILFDVRVTHKTGIYRYICSVFANLCKLEEFSKNFEVYMLAYPHQEEIVSIYRKSFDKDKILYDNSGIKFTRNSKLIRKQILSINPHLYYSFYYIVDSKLNMPFIYTIYDLLRIKFPQFSYSDKEFINKFGTDEFESVRETLQSIGNIEINEGIFNAYFETLNYFLAKRATSIATISFAVAQDISRILDLNMSDKVFYAPCAVDRSIFNKGVSPYSTNSMYMLFIGLAHNHKRFDFLLEAFSEVVKHNAEVKLYVVSNHIDQFEKYKIKIKELNLEGRVLLLTNIDDNKLASLYKSACCTVISSIDEGFCLPMVESLSVGTLVVAPDIPVMHECSNDSAIFYNPYSVYELSNVLIKIINNPFKIHFKNEYDWKKSAKFILEKLYQNA